jgi:hypothetical protein
MPLVEPQARSIGYLILRHLYDGDIIDWPIDDDHPQRAIFADLEAQGFIARWDRIWPLHDRYRLTEKGIAAIEAVYKPSGADEIYLEMQRRKLKPADRRAFLSQRGCDPTLWPLLHDPWTHWSTYDPWEAQYQSYVWEDQLPFRRTRRAGIMQPIVRDPVVNDVDDDDDTSVPVGVVDLDREVGDPGHHGPAAGDYDVS